GRASASRGGIRGGATGRGSLACGPAVTLTATPAAGAVFAGWSGGGCSGTSPCAVTLTAATTVTATFTLQPVPLTVTPAGTGSGTVTSSPAGINCGAICTASFASGAAGTLTATPDAGPRTAGRGGG